MTELHPTVTSRPTTFLSRETQCFGDFAFYEGSENTKGGRITKETMNEVLVHRYMWLPTWIDKSGEQKRATKKPQGFTRDENRGFRRDTITTGKLPVTDRTKSSTIKEVANRGLLTKNPRIICSECAVII